MFGQRFNLSRFTRFLGDQPDQKLVVGGPQLIYRTGRQLEEFLIPCPCYQESICGDEAASVLKNTPFAGSLEAVNRRQTAKQKEKQEIFRRQIIFPNVSNRKHLPNTVHHKQLQRNQNEDDQHFN